MLGAPSGWSRVRGEAVGQVQEGTGQHLQDLVGSREVTERWTGSGLDPDRPGRGPTLPTWAVCPQHVPRPLGLGSLRSHTVMGALTPLSPAGWEPHAGRDHSHIQHFGGVPSTRHRSVLKE